MRRAGRLTLILLVILYSAGVWTGLVIGARTLAGAILRPPANMTPTQAQMDPAHELWVPHVDVMALCRMALGNPPPGRYWQACYLRGADVAVLPSDWPSKSEARDLRIHEHAHRVFGWVHAVK